MCAATAWADWNFSLPVSSYEAADPFSGCVARKVPYKWGMEVRKIQPGVYEVDLSEFSGSDLEILDVEVEVELEDERSKKDDSSTESSDPAVTI